MNNLKLGMKMLLLTAILAVTAAGVAWVGLYRLGTLNAAVQDMVNRTLAKVNLASRIRAELLAAVRQQKNTVISPDDKSSTEYANASKAAVANVERMILDLQKLSALDKNDEEAEAITDLNDKVRRFIPINQQCLDLGVLNTNVKAANLCWREVKSLIDQIVALADKVMSDAENPRTAGDPTKASRGGRVSPPQTRLRDGQDGALAAQDSQTAHRDKFGHPGICAHRSAGDRTEGPAQPVLSSSSCRCSRKATRRRRWPLVPR